MKGYIAVVKQSPEPRHSELEGTKVLIETEPYKCEDGEIIVRVRSLKTGKVDVMDINNFDRNFTFQKPTLKDRFKIMLL